MKSGGISEKLASSGAIWPYFGIAPYILITPFPFYAKPAGPNGEPGRFVDYVFNAGGLMNQLCLSLYLGGLVCWLCQKKWALFFLCGPLVYSFCAFMLLSGGQSRWIMSVAYPFYFLATAAAVQVIRQARVNRWLAVVLPLLVLLLMYGAYGAIKADYGMIFILLFFGSALAMVQGLFAYLIYRACGWNSTARYNRNAGDKSGKPENRVRFSPGTETST
jgi:hypothetical protein